jgi:hypothetical protein
MVRGRWRGRGCWRPANGFIASGPIPGCRGAASCRPPRSWPLGRRSGRVPAWPYPPPRLLQCIGDHGHRAMPGLGQPLARRDRGPHLEPRARIRRRFQDPRHEENGRRGVESGVYNYRVLISLYIYYKEDCPRRDCDPLGHRSVLPPFTSCLRAPAGSAQRSFEGHGQRCSVQSPIRPIRRSCYGHDTLEVTDLSYPIGSVPDRPRETHDPQLSGDSNSDPL